MLIHICTYLVLTLYGIGLTLIVLYSIGQLHLVVTFLKNRRRNLPEPPLTGDENLPFVTIQLPIYNELYVVERLLEKFGDPERIFRASPVELGITRQALVAKIRRLGLGGNGGLNPRDRAYYQQGGNPRGGVGVQDHGP